MDKINIKGLEFYAKHGVLEIEKERGQVFSIDCEIQVDTSNCKDKIENTIHYGNVSMDIVEFATSHTYDLLESLVNKLAKFLLTKYRMAKEITVTVHKPHAPIPTKFEDVSVTVTRGWHTAYLAIGSNLGDKKAYLDMVSEEIEADENMELVKTSSYIETEPYGVTDQPTFMNGAVKVRTIYTPWELLDFCSRVEQKAGRVRKRHWGERTLDVDIIMYENEVIFTDELKVPHPEMHLRDFVLRPLVEIEPYLIHPLLGVNVQTLLERVNGKQNAKFKI